VLYRLAEGVRTEPLDNAWASFSARSGETLLLNTEAAAILELLANGLVDEAEVARTLAADTDTDIVAVSEALRHIWDQLLAAGLVESAAAPEHNAVGWQQPTPPTR
jgi:PqqD family protein of HPr-rel-A system